MLFREIDTGVKSAAWNMAADDVLLKRQIERNLPTMRFLSFERCALVGYFQSVLQEIRTDYCHEKGIVVNRRITGGGAIYFDPSQVGWEIIAPLSLFGGSPTKFYEIFGTSVANGLKHLGINAEFKPRNDIEVDGRKISGMGGVTYKDAFLFQGTLLVEDRIEEMLYSLRVPIEKLKPKEIDSVRERVTCIQHEIGLVPSREELKEAIRRGFKETLGIQTQKSEIEAEELKGIEQSLPYFFSPEWVGRVQLPQDSQGLLTGTHRSTFGTIKVNMTVNAKQKMLRSTVVTGDFFFERGKALFDLERLLRNIRFDENAVLATARDFLRPYPEMPEQDFIAAFKEVFKKWAWVKEGFTPKEANSLFAVNFQPGDEFSPKFFLFPYCAKEVGCSFRHRQDCPQCSRCLVGEGYNLVQAAGLAPLTIINFDDLLRKFGDMRAQGASAYLGSCCEPFYVKHQEEFRDSGLKGLLINVKDSTCYDLGQARQAYLGTFDNQTSLDMPLIVKVLGYIKKKL